MVRQERPDIDTLPCILQSLIGGPAQILRRDARAGSSQLEARAQSCACKRLLASKTRSRGPFDVLMGNSTVFFSLIWSISRFYSPIKWSISRYSRQKIATLRANIPGARRTSQANIWLGGRTKETSIQPDSTGLAHASLTIKNALPRRPSHTHTHTGIQHFPCGFLKSSSIGVQSDRRLALIWSSVGFMGMDERVSETEILIFPFMQ